MSADLRPWFSLLYFVNSSCTVLSKTMGRFKFVVDLIDLLGKERAPYALPSHVVHDQTLSCPTCKLQSVQLGLSTYEDEQLLPHDQRGVQGRLLCLVECPCSGYCSRRVERFTVTSRPVRSVPEA